MVNRNKTLLACLCVVLLLAGGVTALVFPQTGVPTAEAATTIGDLELAEYWAPVWYQDTDSSDYDADYITNFDFDDNWTGTDNWENQPNFTLKAYIYYWVVETETHWFIGYADFHPRDWSDIPLDPQHENDMEGSLLVIKKDGSTYGQFLLMLTIAHLDFYSYKDYNTSPSKDVTDGHETIDGDVQFYQGHHPYIYVEAKGHGVYGDKRWETNDFPGGDGVVYYYTGTAEEPSGGNDRNVGYALKSIDELWSRRYDYTDTFDSFGAFKGDSTSKANAPWGWDDWDDGEVFAPDFFMDPAYLVDYYHDGLGTFSSSYIYRSYGGIVETFHPYRSDYHRVWTWHVPGAEWIRVHFTRIQTEAGDDYISFYDKNDSQVGDRISDIYLDHWSPWVEGDTIKIGLDTDSDINYFWGFYADEVEYQDVPVISDGIIVEGANAVWTSGLEHSSDLDNVAQNVTPRIVVEYADYVSELRLQVSTDLNLVADTISSRIVVEYADSISEFGLQGSVNLNQAASAVMPRIIVEYADSIVATDLGRPLFVSPSVRNLTASQRSGTGIVDISYEVFDARQSVTISFQYWNGSQWVDCATTTGGGQVAIGSNIGTWNAKADFDSQYRADMKIQVIADNGEAVNNINQCESPAFTLDTEAPSPPGLVAPVGGAAIGDTAPTLDWSDTSDPSGATYILEVDDDSGFSSPLLTKTGLVTSQYSLSSAEALSEGTYYWRVRAIDGMGNQGNWASTLFSVDTTNPTVTLNNISDFVNSLASISGTASDISPGELEKVQVQIQNTTDSTYWNGSSWVAGATWVDATGTTTWNYTMPTLTDGKAYMVKAKSIDKAGNESGEASDSFIYDTTAPVVMITNVSDFVNSLSSITGTASNATSGVALVQIRISDASTNRYWDGDSWEYAETWLNASGTTSWSYNTSGMSWGEGHSYTASAKASDNAGNISTPETDGFTYDTTSPTVTLNNIPDFVNSLAQISGTTYDVSPGELDKVQVKLKNATDSTYWNGTSWVSTETWLDTTGTSNWSYTMPTLTDSKEYTVKAKATDKAGNTSAVSSDSFTFQETPAAAFMATPASGNAPLTVQFTDQSTGIIDSCAWDFGDGETSNQRNPSHAYGSPGTYSVTLTVTGPGGTDTETKTDYITITAPPPPAPTEDTPLGLPVWVWIAIGAGVVLLIGLAIGRLARK